MNAGRMVFSRSWPEGNWHADSHLDDYAWYICEKKDYGGWLAKFVRRRDDQTDAPPLRRLVESEDLGWRLKLAEAKRICDEHHHAAILASDDESVKGYVTRWPL